MHGAEIMHTSEVILLLNHMKRTDILEEWRKIPRPKDTIQIMIVWKGHIIHLKRPVSNFKDLRKKARDDPTLLGYDALAKNWVEELRKAIDSADRECSVFAKLPNTEILQPTTTGNFTIGSGARLRQRPASRVD
jgi:hypothetical protein